MQTLTVSNWHDKYTTQYTQYDKIPKLVLRHGPLSQSRSMGYNYIDYVSVETYLAVTAVLGPAPEKRILTDFGLRYGSAKGNFGLSSYFAVHTVIPDRGGYLISLKMK